ncbi:hypothetical protein F4823DRAFT_560503 [Ustulina deusta]|nr:hypothetical protein F4823DRAFT_560503 [Ustulina deusta]
MSNKPSAWEIVQCGPITLVSATYGTVGQLHQNVISGPKLAFNCLPEEGLYILYGNRGLQIASACDRRKCYITQVCRCAEQQRHIHANINSTIETRTVNKSTLDTVSRYWKGYVLTWLHLYQAAEEIRSCRLCFLAHPRTLSWGNIFDNLTFHFDYELDEYYASIHSYVCPAHKPQSVHKGVKQCPQGVIEFIYDAWRDFLDCGDYSLKPAMTPGRGGDDQVTENDNNYTNDGKDMNGISEWDDADVPISLHNNNDYSSTVLPNHHKETPRLEGDFDLIDDLIEEEFPRLKKTSQRARQAKEGVKQHRRTPRRKFATTHEVPVSAAKDDLLTRYQGLIKGLARIRL